MSISSVLPRPTPPHRYSPRSAALFRALNACSKPRGLERSRRAQGVQARGRLVLSRVELQAAGGDRFVQARADTLR